MSTYLGIDLGTSFIKGAVLDLERGVLRDVQRIPFPSPVRVVPPYYHEIDPREVALRTRGLLDMLLRVAPEASGLMVCSQMHALVLTDDAGDLASNCISWLDQRALESHPSRVGSYFEVLSERIHGEEAQELGNALHPSLPICSLFWYVESGHLPPNEVTPVSLADFVLARLCGVRPTMERTHAAAHGAFNLRSDEWHWGVIDRLGLLPGLRWPTLVETGTIIGWAEIGATRLRCHAPVADHQCALVGALLDDGELSVNVSTGSQVALLSPRFEFGDYEVRPFFDGRFLKTVTRIPAGRALNALMKLLCEMAEAHGLAIEDPWRYAFQAAQAAGETDLRVDLSFFPSACGSVGGISGMRENNTTVGHLFRGAFQSMAENYWACAQRIAGMTGWRRLVFSGGLVQNNEVLRTLIANRFGVPYRMSPEPEDTLLGLLALGVVFSGQVSSVEQAVSELRRVRLGGPDVRN